MKTASAANDAAIEIALVNNMPDQAVEATKSQFERLLLRGAQGLPCRPTHRPKVRSKRPPRPGEGRTWVIRTSSSQRAGSRPPW